MGDVRLANINVYANKTTMAIYFGFAHTSELTQLFYSRDVKELMGPFITARANQFGVAKKYLGTSQTLLIQSETLMAHIFAKTPEQLTELEAQELPLAAADYSFTKAVAYDTWTFCMMTLLGLYPFFDTLKKDPNRN